MQKKASTPLRRHVLKATKDKKLSLPSERKKQQKINRRKFLAKAAVGAAGAAGAAWLAGKTVKKFRKKKWK